MNFLEAHPDRVANLVLLGALDPKNGKREFFTRAELRMFGKRQAETKSFKERDEVQVEIEEADLDRPDLSVKERHRLRRIRSAGANLYHVERWRQLPFFFVDREAAEATRTSTEFVYDWAPMLSAHPFRVTVINGVYDYVVGPKASPIWKRVIRDEAPNVELVLLDEAGHASWIDDPAGFRDGLARALTPKGR